MYVLPRVILFCLAVDFGSGQLDKLDCITKGPKANLYRVTDTERDLITDGTSLNSDADTYFVIHGWIENSNEPEYLPIGREIYEKTKGNVILVDYEELAQEFYGTCAWSIVRQLGDTLTAFIVQETNAKTMHPSRIHIIGHSLGGQTAGYVGRHVQKKIPGTIIKRISALDPAGPFFTLVVAPLPTGSLSAKDAKMVDVLHTSFVFGSYVRMGTVDFYAKGIMSFTTDYAPCGVFSNIFCSHLMSKSLFRESITSCGIVAQPLRIFNKADATLIYGFHMPLNATGIYTFSVNPKSPYGKGAATC